MSASRCAVVYQSVRGISEHRDNVLMAPLFQKQITLSLSSAIPSHRGLPIHSPFFYLLESYFKSRNIFLAVQQINFVLPHHEGVTIPR